MPLKLNRKELLNLIESIEAGGGDATALRDALDPTTESTDLKARDIIEAMKKDSPLVEGDDLKCVVCGSQTTRLWSQACEQCFSGWALSAKKGHLNSKEKKRCKSIFPPP